MATAKWDREMGGVGDDELGAFHRARDGVHGQLALALAAGAFGFGAAFGFLAFVLDLLQAHFQAFHAPIPLQGKVEHGDDHQAAAQLQQQADERFPRKGHLAGQAHRA
jgi:hypothetical protein